MFLPNGKILKMSNKEEIREENLMPIPKPKRKYYKNIKVSKEIRELIKLVNYWQRKAK